MTDTSLVDTSRYSASHPLGRAHRALLSCSAAPRALDRRHVSITPVTSRQKCVCPGSSSKPASPALPHIPSCPPASAALRPACSLSSIRQYCHINIIINTHRHTEKSQHGLSPCLINGPVDVKGAIKKQEAHYDGHHKIEFRNPPAPLRSAVIALVQQQTATNAAQKRTRTKRPSNGRSTGAATTLPRPG